MRFAFMSSAQATFFRGIRIVLCFPDAPYSIWLFFPEILWIPVKWTLTMTAPSFRCRLTFLPRYDLALLALKLSKHFTTRFLRLRFCSSTAGISAVFRPLTRYRVWYFHFCNFLSKGFYNAPFSLPLKSFLAFFAFKAVARTVVWRRGGMTESESLYIQKSEVKWAICPFLTTHS